MNKADDIQKGLMTCEALAQELLHQTLQTRMLIEKAGVSTPATGQISDEELAKAGAKRRQRLQNRKGR
jgi:hypothetical protein